MTDDTNELWLQEKEKYLKNARLQWADYKMPKPTWDHDHCEFCWEKFMEGGQGGTKASGYRLESEDVWVCKECFHKYQSRYNWTSV